MADRFVVRRYCERGWFRRRWEWLTVGRFNDEQIARKRFAQVVQRDGYSPKCRGYELVAPQGVIMSAWDYRR